MRLIHSIGMSSELNEQNQLEAFRNEWDGAVHFQTLDDHTVRINIAGEEKFPPAIKERVREMRIRFMEGEYETGQQSTVTFFAGFFRAVTGAKLLSATRALRPLRPSIAGFSNRKGLPAQLQAVTSWL